MRHSSSAWCVVATAALGAILLTGFAPNGQARADEATADEAPVVDSGWAVSSTKKAGAEEGGKESDSGPVFVKPEKGAEKPEAKTAKPKTSAKSDEAKPTNGQPRIAALPQPPKPLKWIPAGVGQPEDKPEQPAPEEKAGEAPKTAETPAEEATEPASEPKEQGTEKPEATESAETSGQEAEEPAKDAADGGDAEPNEPAPFPEVIEIDEELADEADVAEKEPTAEAAPSQTAPPVEVTPKPLKPLTRYQRSLRTRLRSVLSYYYRRPLNSIDHDPWEVMHHMLAYGQHSRVLDGSRRGKPMTAVGYLCYNMPCQRKQMMSLTADGVIETRVDVGMQGHKGQFLAMLAQCGISQQYPMRVDGAELTIDDLIRAEKLSCYSGEELTFKLIGLLHYLEPGDTWVNDQGETWSFPRLINEERNQKIRGAPCGGTHRLSGLSLAVKKREALGQPVDGEYSEAKRFVEQYVNYAYRWQNPDGSLSTEWFRGPGAEEDINRRVRTTGHLLEWLLYTVSDEQLTDRNTVRAVNYLTSLLASNTSNPWEIGPLSHALHALLVYDQRVFEPHDAGLIAAAERSGKKSSSPANLNYRNIDSRVVRSLPSADEAEAARAEIANANTGLRGLFGGRRKQTYRSR